eukprot:3376055-Rhodomonas_salina.2
MELRRGEAREEGGDRSARGGSQGRRRLSIRVEEAREERGFSSGRGEGGRRLSEFYRSVRRQAGLGAMDGWTWTWRRRPSLA